MHRLALAFGAAAALYASVSTAAVSDAQRAIAIAHETCLHPGGIWRKYGMYPTKISDWHARLDGDTWKAWVEDERGIRLAVLIPRHGPPPTERDCRSRDAD